MAVDERSRRTLYEGLEGVLGVAEAATLMEHLPPAGWADVATKQDLAELEHKLLAAFRAEIHGAITAQTRLMVQHNLGMLGAFVALVGLFLGLT